MSDPSRIRDLIFTAGLLVACAEPELPDRADGGAPDGGRVEDGGPPEAAPVTRVDWREVRGAPLEAQTTTLSAPAALIAAFPDTLLARRDCVDELCRLEWRGADGTVRKSFEGATFVHSEPFSLDGERLVLLEHAEPDTCEDGESPRPTVRGTLHAVHARSGEPLYTQREWQGQRWLESAFTEWGGFLRPLHQTSRSCGDVVLELHRSAAPHTPVPWSVRDFWPRWETEAGLLLGLDARDALVLRDPARPAEVRLIADATQVTERRDGYTYGYTGWPTRAVGALTPTGERLSRTIDEGEWYRREACGRWVVLCGRLTDDGPGLNLRYPCRALDLEGELPDRDFELAHPTEQALALLESNEVLLHAAPQSAGATSVEALYLRTGERRRLLPERAHIKPLGAGTRAILHDSARRAWLFEAGAPELLASDVERVLTLSELGDYDRGLPQAEVAFLVRVYAEHLDRPSLDLFHGSSRRLVTVTDRLHFGPTPGGPAHHHGCGYPWLSRPNTAPRSEAWAKTPLLHFLETPTEAGLATLYVMPTDLGAPPRALTQLHPVECSAPLTDSAGRFVALAYERHDRQVRLMGAPLVVVP